MLEQQVHGNFAEVVGSIPDVKGTAAGVDAAAERRKVPGSCVVAVHLEAAV